MLETVLLSIYNHDSAIASAASRMTLAAGDRPASRWARGAPTRRPRSRLARAAYVAGFASTSNLAARQRYGVPTAGTSAHSFTLLHDTEADAFRAQVDSLGGHHPARRHLRRRRGRAARRRGGRARARRGAAGLRRPRRPGRRGARPARLPRRHGHPDRGHQRPRRVRDRRPGRGPGRRLRRRHPAGHRQRPPHVRLRLQAGRPRGRRAARWSRSPRRASTRSRSAAASTRCGAAPPTASPRPRSSGSATPARDDGDDRALLVPLVHDGEVVGREPLDDRSGAAPALAGRAAAGCPADVQGRPGDPAPSSRECADGPPHLRLLLRVALDRGHLDDRRPPAADRGADRRARRDAGRAAARPLPAARPLRRPHAWLRYTSIERYAAAAGSPW